MKMPKYMQAVCLMGHGDEDQLVLRNNIPVPAPEPDEVLVQITATAKNNTDRKARIGLYPVAHAEEVTSFQMGGVPTLTFPRIQGADVVGRIVSVGSAVSADRIGERGLLDFNLYPSASNGLNLMPDYYGHGKDGGFAEYIAVPSDQFHHIANPALSDAELAALGMCSYQTAYHMLTSAQVTAGEHILVSGASGGVGTALIQLCRILGAIPYAISHINKAERLVALGAAAVIDRSDPNTIIEQVLAATGGAPIDAVMDLVGGAMTDRFIDTMIHDMAARSTYPRLSIAGASGGNVSQIMWTRIYLYQVQIFGVSHGTRAEAEQLMHWIREGRLQPVLHRTYKLSELRQAEIDFAQRSEHFLGKIVIVPDAQWPIHGAPFS